MNHIPSVRYNFYAGIIPKQKINPEFLLGGVKKVEFQGTRQAWHPRRDKNPFAVSNFLCFLVDDDPDDQEIFMDVLHEISPSIHCVTACNGEEAINKLKSREVEPDLIFLDLNMPLMNGQQFLKAWKLLEDCSKVPVIILTTSSDKRSVEETMKLGARGYITKPDKYSAWNKAIAEKINFYRRIKQNRKNA